MYYLTVFKHHFSPWLSPSKRAGEGLLFLPVSPVCLFVRLTHSGFRTLIPEHKPHRILSFGTMIDLIKTFLGIVRQLPWLIFELVITYFLSLELVAGLSFLNQTTWDLAFWHNDRSYQDLAWDCSSTSFTIFDLVITYFLSLELVPSL